jgi:hypothetical protein
MLQIKKNIPENRCKKNNANLIITIYTLLLLSIFSTVIAAIEAPQTNKIKSTEIYFLDGEILNTWLKVGMTNWYITKNIIEANDNEDGFLVSQKKYKNFTLRADFMIDETTNSGVFITCKNQQEINPKACYEINIWDKHLNQSARTGAIIFHVMPPLANIDTLGKWNEYEITSINGKITVMLNGIVTARLNNAIKNAGYIALQHAETGSVKFKNISIEQH